MNLILAERNEEWEWAKRHELTAKFLAQLGREAELAQLAAQPSRFTRLERSKRARDATSATESETMPTDSSKRRAAITLTATDGAAASAADRGALPQPAAPPGARVTYCFLRPSELSPVHAALLERIGLGGHESPVKSLHAYVLDCLNGKPARVADPSKYELLFFARRCGAACTGLAMMVRRLGPGLRTRGTVFELRRFASESRGTKGAGAQLHWHMCDALVRYAACRCRWSPPSRLSMTLPLQSCTWRAGPFYKKMGWEHNSLIARRSKRAVNIAHLGGVMRLDLRDRAAWSRYWQPTVLEGAE